MKVRKPAVICLTPVKDESAILDRFLKCASLWADHIIIADQSSKDGSLEIAEKYPKVTVVKNPSVTFDGRAMREVLITAARKIPGPRLLISLDADEILTSNVMNSPEMDTILTAPPGTIIYFQMTMILPDLRSYWMPSIDFPWGFMDDGSEYVGDKIHELRLPLPPSAPCIKLRDIKVMHYVGVDPEKWKSKHRWYQCWEVLNRPDQSAVDIYRRYHRQDIVPKWAIEMMPEQWISNYQELNIDVTSICSAAALRWDKSVLEYFNRYGHNKFKKLAIWDVDWKSMNNKVSPSSKQTVGFDDPRSALDKLIHAWLKRTQSFYSYFPPKKPGVLVRLMQKAIRTFGW